MAQQEKATRATEWSETNLPEQNESHSRITMLRLAARQIRLLISIAFPIRAQRFPLKIQIDVGNTAVVIEINLRTYRHSRIWYRDNSIKSPRALEDCFQTAQVSAEIRREILRSIILRDTHRVRGSHPLSQRVVQLLREVLQAIVIRMQKLKL